jgi:hypothetical protein
MKVGDTISLNLRTFKSKKMVKLGAQCSDEEKEKLKKHLSGFQDVFAWSYEDLHGFYPFLIQHVIPINEGIELVRKKKDPLIPHLKLLFGKSWKNV